MNDDKHRKAWDSINADEEPEEVWFIVLWIAFVAGALVAGAFGYWRWFYT